MRTLFNQANVDKSDLIKYPSARIKDNDGTGNGTGVNEATKGDLHQFFEKIMRLYDITPNDLPDNETNGFQLIDALRGLASKNDFIYPLSTNGTILSVDIKFSQMLENEYIICLAAFDKGEETQIKGLGTATFAIAYSGNFKTNEYVRVIKTNVGISIIRVADAISLDAMVADYLYLKKASQAQENAGTIDTVATTPLVNKVAYTLRTIGADSANYLATAARNGLYPKEHFSIVAGIGSSPVKNYGTISLDPGNTSGTIPSDGDFGPSASMISTGPDSIVTVTMSNAMVGSNYYCRSFIQGQSSSLNSDNDLCSPVFKPLNSSQFQIAFREVSAGIQSVKVHIEVVQL